MPFKLYSIISRDNQDIYCFLKNIRLAGTSGPIYNCLSPYLRKDLQIQTWHLTSKEIISKIDTSGTTDLAIIIDLKPRDRNHVSIYRLLDIWGYSYQTWTPIAMLLEELFADRSVVSPATFKDEFAVPKIQLKLIGEFLYMNGGTLGKGWSWGMVGYVNGALLSCESFKYLAEELSLRLAQ